MAGHAALFLLGRQIVGARGEGRRGPRRCEGRGGLLINLDMSLYCEGRNEPDLNARARIFYFFDLCKLPNLADNACCYPLLTIRGQMTTWLNLEELAEYLKLPKSTLYKMAGAGKVPGHKIGRSYRFDRDEVDASIKKTRTQPIRRGIGRRSR